MKLLSNGHPWLFFYRRLSFSLALKKYVHNVPTKSIRATTRAKKSLCTLSNTPSYSSSCLFLPSYKLLISVFTLSYHYMCPQSIELRDLHFYHGWLFTKPV